MLGVIDRFEGKYAIIVMDDGRVTQLEVSKLPSKAKEKDVLEIKEEITINTSETKRRKNENKKFLDLWEED